MDGWTDGWMALYSFLTFFCTLLQADHCTCIQPSPVQSLTYLSFQPAFKLLGLLYTLNELAGVFRFPHNLNTELKKKFMNVATS
jgi:hypothetical protein